MNRRANSVFCFLLGVLIFSPALTADEQGWMNHSASFKIDSTFSLKLTRETRFHEITYMDAYLENWQGGMVARLPKDFYFAALYKRESTKKAGYILAENRYTLETGWKTKVSEKLDFDWRLRTEIRSYAGGRAENHLRFRIRARLKADVFLGSLKLRPFIGTEPFGDTLADRINRNRFYLGTVFPLSKNVELVVNYIRQDTKGKDTIHILNSGFDLKF